MDSLIYFKALSDLTRIRLFNILLQYELNVNEIVTLMEMGQSRISRHLKILIDAGLLKCRRDGVWAFYSVVEEEPHRRFIDAIRYLFDNEAQFKKDALIARQLVDDRREATMQFFNTIATEWDLLKREILGDFDLNEAILKHIKPCNTAVDLGCGTGELLSCIKVRANHVIGVDSSPQMLDEAWKRFQDGKQRMDLRLGDMEHLPLSDGEADCAVISMVLHHLSRPEAAITEVYRILKSGGSLVLADFNKHGNEAMRHAYSDRWLGFSSQDISHWLSHNGFVLTLCQSFKIQQTMEINIYQANKKGENYGFSRIGSVPEE